MSKEDKQFFDGLLLGGVLVGIVLVVFIIYAFFRNPQPLGDYTYTIQKQNSDTTKEQLLNVLIETTPEEAFIPQPITSLSAADKQYITLVELKNIQEGLVYRLLAEDTSENRLKLQEAIESDILPHCLDTLSGFTPTLSIWDQNGERLLHMNENTFINTQSFSICPVVRKWHNSDLIIEQAYGDAGIAEQIISSYSTDGEITQLLSSITEFTLNEDDINAHYQSWTHDDIIFTQYVSDTFVSDLMMSTVPISERMSLERATIAYETNGASVKADLTSNYNLRNYSKGLEYTIGGERVVLPWKVK